MTESYVLKYIMGMFDDISKECITQNVALNEINSMRNTQPPENPTFILNQTEAKERIKNKFISSYKENAFMPILLSGLVGDGKTHFLNRIYSYFKENNNFYIIKFRVEDTERSDYNFTKMIMSEIFSKYYRDFRITFNNIINTIPFSNDDEETLSYFRETLDISDNLSKVLFSMKSSNDLEGPALRVLGSRHGKTELKKLDIDLLSTDDYLEVFKLFIQNKTRNGLFIIMLDEFEHAHTSLKPNAKKGFFQSYKNFIDKAATESNYKELVIVTAITEQYEGELKNGLTNETALWTRLEPNSIKLKSFLLSQEELNKLLDELSYRYSLAYDFPIIETQYTKIIKALRIKFKDSQPRSYRVIVSSILNIMDDIRYNNFDLKNYSQDEIILNTVEIESEEYDLFNLPELNPLDNNKSNYELLIEQVKEDWGLSSVKMKSSKLKTSIELALKEIGHSISIVKHPSVFSSYFDEKINQIFIGYGQSKRIVTSKFNNFLDYLDNMDEEEKQGITPYFIYPLENYSEGFELKLSRHPQIVAVGVELTLLYSLLALRLVDDESLKIKIKNNLKGFYKFFEEDAGGE
ncbi:BREX system ATP-binding domain-containing protein [Lysinibacillus sp. NPDC056220]|uniref:BREX system ATP-binding domain-containing protein n=1 Tax=Lysinibacillus sp. NPDC056220 TaxID=3398580 RepID=UPI003BF45F2D